MSVEIETRGLDALLAFFRDAPEAANRAAVLATNDSIDFARRVASKDIREQVNFTTGYLAQPNRLNVTRKATSSEVEAVLSARSRATSLANPIFNKTTPTFGRRRGKRPVRVKVARNGGGEIQDAFFIKLRGAKDGFNVGLAVRTKDGRSPRGTRGAKPIFGGSAWLLYGPSVGQIAFDVFPDISNDVAGYQVDQFVRQFERLTNGR